jgi:hypothetical protein
MKLVVKNIAVVGAGLLFGYVGPWWLVGPVVPFFVLLFFGFAWANVRV